MIIQFEAGKTYTVYNADGTPSLLSFTVEKRTAKSVITSKGQRLAITEYNGVEQTKKGGKNAFKEQWIKATDNRPGHEG